MQQEEKNILPSNNHNKMKILRNQLDAFFILFTERSSFAVSRDIKVYFFGQ